MKQEAFLLCDKTTDAFFHRGVLLSTVKPVCASGYYAEIVIRVPTMFLTNASGMAE